MSSRSRLRVWEGWDHWVAPRRRGAYRVAVYAHCRQSTIPNAASKNVDSNQSHMNIRFRENPEIPAVYRRFAVGVGAFFTIAASQVAGGQQSTSAASDTSLLSAILKAAISEVGPVELRVDPRPLVADSAVYGVEPQVIAPISPAVLRQRTAVIRAAGLRTVDATKVGQNKDCPGVFVIIQHDLLRNPNTHAGCPDKSFYVLAVALPRPGRDVLPGDEVYNRDVERAARGYWAARVIQTNLGPGGSSVKASDYVLAKRAGTWVVIKMVGLMYAE